ncbi:acyl-CoA thioesterase [Paraglaciecola polaris]|uniref:Acyl-CoA thioester hydrolase n=1 Tax=Paraglaciecola polaris LMG 21857 TaxID=1129793 RepID=K6ZEF5_9ALTE|nr:acyl-CoA thioesterase [Paraglaciecola polaris]GAC34461.1 acyl-CoA thioester hydrolase [Paraglaciecola polaris LMG 21857]|tara:strand:- start:4282 stop:4746 length:465 start_codon:yes stop_codon:yes gene_type:complete
MPTSVEQLPWQYPSPFICQWHISPEQIDHYNHVNNVAYVSQLERTAWAHSNALGLSIEQYQELDRGMAISRHEIDYLAAAVLGDTLACATWIVACDNKLKLARHFQFIRLSDGLSMLKARTEFVCIALSSGKPKRMPKIFSETYFNAMLINPAE